MAIARFRDPANVDSALAELAKFWDDYLAALQVKTPDANFNSMINVHNPRQCNTRHRAYRCEYIHIPAADYRHL